MKDGRVHDSANEGARFAVLNSFDALDAPGEYVLKRSAGSQARLYFIPPTSSAGRSQELLLSTKLNPNPLIGIDGANHVRLQNLVIKAGRGDAVSVDGDDVQLTGLTVRNMGRSGIVANGIGIHINGSEFSEIAGR